ELAEGSEDRQADLVTGYFSTSRGPDVVLGPLSQQRQRVLVDRTSLARRADPVEHLLPAERLGCPRTLHDGERHRVDGREPALARGALAPTPDDRTVLRRAGVDHATVAVPAEGAVHAKTPASEPDRDLGTESWGQTCALPGDGL